LFLNIFLLKKCEFCFYLVKGTGEMSEELPAPGGRLLGAGKSVVLKLCINN
jgi:hypothetical protein